MQSLGCAQGETGLEATTRLHSEYIWFIMLEWQAAVLASSTAAGRDLHIILIHCGGDNRVTGLWFWECVGPHRVVRTRNGNGMYVCSALNVQRKGSLMKGEGRWAHKEEAKPMQA